MSTRSLKASPDGIKKAKHVLALRGLNQTELSHQLSLSRTTISSFFSGDPIERENFKSICKYLELDVKDIAEIANPKAETSQSITPPEDLNTQPQIPDESSVLIEEKAQLFCGRGFVFEAFEQFLEQELKGYFTVVGEPGIGKSAIAAKYVKDHHAIRYFNMVTNGRNRPDFFLSSIRAQLIRHYDLQCVEQAHLELLLERASQRLRTGERLIIVVDALDEVAKQDPRENLLHLPSTLPNGVYFLLTRRPYSSENKQLRLELETPERKLDLTKSEYEDCNRADVIKYIHLILPKLRPWIQARNLQEQEFIEQLVDKSQNNFMYLKCVSTAIAKGGYDDLELTQLPDGLRGYYNLQWERLEMDKDPKKAIRLYILVEIGSPLSIQEIAKISREDKCEVGHTLRQWYGVFRVQEELYSIYHNTFLDFLKSKDDLDKDRLIFNEVNDRISDYYQETTDYYLNGG